MGLGKLEGSGSACSSALEECARCRKVLSSAGQQAVLTGYYSSRTGRLYPWQQLL